MFKAYLLQFPRLKTLMQVTPVIEAIELMINIEQRIIINPITAKVRVLRAPSNCFASPPELIIFIPDKTIKITAVMPARAKTTLKTSLYIYGRQLNIGALVLSELKKQELGQSI